MDAKDVIRTSLQQSKMVTDMLLADLSDAEIMERPVAEANHIAWQLGHLVTSFNFFGESIEAGSMPALPEGFNEKHSKETAAVNDADAFYPKEQYVKLLDDQRQAMLNLLDGLDPSRLEDESPEALKSYAPRIVDMLALAGAHEIMHSGQLSVLRRRLGKPVAF